MTAPALALLALGLSVDAMIAAMGRGAALDRPRLLPAMRIALLFAAMEAGLATLGWMMGHAAGQALAEWDHWIAFGLLSAVGLRMMMGGAREVPTRRAGALGLVVAAFGSSVDAMAVGGSLALVDAPILPLALTVAAATFAATVAGVMLAGMLGARFGAVAERAGGALLIGLGLSILIAHLA